MSECFMIGWNSKLWLLAFLFFQILVYLTNTRTHVYRWFLKICCWMYKTSNPVKILFWYYCFFFLLWQSEDGNKNSTKILEYMCLENSLTFKGFGYHTDQKYFNEVRTCDTWLMESRIGTFFHHMYLLESKLNIVCASQI